MRVKQSCMLSVSLKQVETDIVGGWCKMMGKREPEGRRERSGEQGKRGRDRAKWRPSEREGFQRTRAFLVFLRYSPT